MRYQFEFRVYRRQFRQPLKTHHGVWRDRVGIILRLADAEGRVGFGEIAPLEWFGSESLEQALEFCRRWDGGISQEEIFAISDALPACQFGFESAWEMGWLVPGQSLGDAIPQTPSLGDKGCPPNPLRRRYRKECEGPVAQRFLRGEGGQGQGQGQGQSYSSFGADGGQAEGDGLGVMHSSQCTWEGAETEVMYCGLLPSGAVGLEGWRSLYDQGTRTFKWKIGVTSVEEELWLFEQLVRQLPEDALLRLDANGGLDWEGACRWLGACDAARQVEFLEQPLPPAQFEAMQKLRECYRTMIALDESVANVGDLEACYARGWRGVFVVKAAIAGSPRRLRAFCRRFGVDVVWSSVFETAIARQYIETRLVEALATVLEPQLTTKTRPIASLPMQSIAFYPQRNRALGFGVSHWFAESSLDQSNVEQLWQSL